MIKIGYFADGAWAHKAFEKLIIDKTIQITFICVRYDNPDKILMKYAEKYNIDLLCHKNINSEEFLEKLRSYNADLFVSMSFNQIFKKEILELPVLNSINCHAGKLPFYRGRNVLTWALINDETEFGITVHYIDLGIDTGDIILQEVFSITDEDDYNTLLQRAYDGCASILYKAIKLIQDNKVSTIKQEDIDKVGTYCGMRKCGDEIINWNQTSREIFNFVRALCSPGPIATSYIDGVEIKINKVKLIEGAHKYKNINGQVIGKTKQGFLVKTLDTLIEVIEYDYSKQVKVGDRLGGGI